MYNGRMWHQWRSCTPPVDSPELQPYAAPLGRLMLGYGRAVTAAIALAQCALGSEFKAAELVTNDNLPKRMRKLFRVR